jgi:methyl-accepting chemotaxis protein
VGSVSGKEDVNKIKASGGSGLTIDLTYSYDPLWPQIKSEVKLINGMLFLGMIFFSLSLYLISRKLIKPLTDVVDILSESTSLTTEHATKLKEMSASVQTSGDIINSGSESTTSSMQELTTMIESSVKELNKCMELADSVNSKADQGTDVMNRLVGSMEVIEEANMRLNELGTIFEEISSKTSVINDIVFKTQLLSFNASIEAARAGQHGRGFSVVAEEIGNLAQMSGKSATEISNLLSSSEGHVKNIISGTDEKIAEGRAVSLEALQSFDDIRRDIGEITESIQGVTTSSQGQEGAIKSTLNTMINMKETVMEQGIYTRSIGKSAHAISDQSDKLERAEFHAKRLIYGTAANHDNDDEMNNDSKKMVMHLVNKMGKSKMEVADEDVA